MGAGWRLWLGLILEVLGILVAVFQPRHRRNTGGLGIGSVNRNRWPDPGFVLVQGSPRVVVTNGDLLLDSFQSVITRSTRIKMCHAAAVPGAF